MAVFTHVDDDSIRRLLSDFEIGDFVRLEGIAQGVENSNYHLFTSEDRYILTLYEKRVDEADLPFFIGLMEHLARAGFPAPLPVASRSGASLHQLCGRRAAITGFLQGRSEMRPAVAHCAQTGEALARLHLASAGFSLPRPNALSLASWHDMANAIGPDADRVKPGLAAEIAETLRILDDTWPTDLPRGVIHADMFPDNVFFRNGRLSGVIDFYFACHDHLVYDIAICLNAWCFERDGQFNITKASQFLQHYESVRPLSEAEWQALPNLARGSALRFLLTRLHDWLQHDPDALVTPKDPREYLNILRFHADVKTPLAYAPYRVSLT